VMYTRRSSGERQQYHEHSRTDAKDVLSTN
jgi:hypothetical protein